MTSFTTLTQSLQDYLEVILNLSEQENSVRITDIAARLDIAKPSVNQAINTLKEMGLVVQEKYGPVRLTERGREEAAKVWYKHQVLRDFMINVLQVEAAIAERDACEMEHVVSSQTMERIAEFLAEHQGRMSSDRDKAEIDGSHAAVTLRELKDKRQVETKQLSELLPGSRTRVIRIMGSGTLRRRIMEMGIIPGVEMKIERVAPLGDPVELNIKGYYLSLRKEEAASVFVEVLE